jgi:transposase-like protein
MSVPRRSRAEWHELVAAWKRSGLSCAEYARQHDLNAHTFSWWRSEVARDRGRAPELNLVPVTTAAVPPLGEPIEVALPGGVVVRVPDEADPTRVARLVRALVAAC